MSTPPSFDTFFNNQQYGRQSSGNSTSRNNYSQQIHPDQQQGNDIYLTDEPSSLSRHASLGNHYEGRADSLAYTSRGNRNGGPIKQDSVPFDPSSSSTLIATAPRQSNRASPHANDNGIGIPIDETIFGQSLQPGYGPPDYQPFRNDSWGLPTDGFRQYGQFDQMSHGMDDHSGHFPQHPPQSAMGFDTQVGTNDAAVELSHGNRSPYSPIAMTPNQPTDGAWSRDFLGQTTLDLNGGQEWMHGAGWSSENGNENVLSAEEQEQLHELERM